LLTGRDLRSIARNAFSRHFKLAVSQGVSCGLISGAVSGGRSPQRPVARGIEHLIRGQILYPSRSFPGLPAERLLRRALRLPLLDQIPPVPPSIATDTSSLRHRSPPAAHLPRHPARGEGGFTGRLRASDSRSEARPLLSHLSSCCWSPTTDTPTLAAEQLPEGDCVMRCPRVPYERPARRVRRARK
jgi:hypothetical protein